MKKAGIIFNPDKPRAFSELKKLKSWLSKRNCRVLAIPSSASKIPALDFAVTLGGDGTMLKASRILAPKGIPVLGVNLGSLGFLAETNPNEVLPLLSKILAGNMDIEERMMLDIKLKQKNRAVSLSALNECIIHSGSNGRVITVSAKLDNDFLANYIGDGLIISTPTGSTAYSLAAFGPIVHPHLSLFILTPVCPHTLTQRPIIFSTRHTLSFKAVSQNVKEKPVLFIDGQQRFTLEHSDNVSISASPDPLRLIINPKRHYLRVLQAKLKWGERGDSISASR